MNPMHLTFDVAIGHHVFDFLLIDSTKACMKKINSNERIRNLQMFFFFKYVVKYLFIFSLYK